MAIGTQQRFKRGSPCPVCGGHDDAGRGKGERCFGFRSDDGEWVHCTRSEHAGAIPITEDSQTYAHKMHGTCNCGEEHGPSQTRQIVATYPYTDENGTVLFEVVRFSPKSFAQRRPDPSAEGGYTWKLGDVRRVLYRLPDVIAAQVVCVVEGEKDADLLRSTGIIATCNPHGAGKWRDEYAQALSGKSVVVIPDNDTAGREHALAVAKSVLGVARGVKILDLVEIDPSQPLPPKCDVTEWFGGSDRKAELIQAVKAIAPLDTATLNALRLKWFPKEPPQRPTFWSFADVVASVGSIDKFLAPPLGLQTPWPKLNNWTCGLQAGDFILLAARPSMGKTWAAIQLAHCVTAAGKPVAFYSLEMSKESVFRRLLIQVAEIDGHDLRAGRLDTESRSRLLAAVNRINGLPLRITDSVTSTVASALAEAKKLEPKPALVVIDYLGLMSGRGKDRNAEVSGISRELKLGAREIGIPFVVLCQLNRGLETRGVDAQPQLSDLRDSGTLEQDADLVLFIHQPKGQGRDPGARLPLEVKFQIAKQRNGPVGTIDMLFIPHTGIFREVQG